MRHRSRAFTQAGLNADIGIFRLLMEVLCLGTCEDPVQTIVLHAHSDADIDSASSLKVAPSYITQGTRSKRLYMPSNGGCASVQFLQYTQELDHYAAIVRGNDRRERCMWNTTWKSKADNARKILLPVIASLAIGHFVVGRVRAQDALVDRGKYLVTLGGCTDCHTPGHLLGKPDMTHFLGGSDVGFSIPGLGVFVGRNLTPDQETGIGSWTREQIANVLTTGVRPDGRVLAPVMPYVAYAQMTREDALAIAAYLQSLPPVKREVPGPFGPSDKVSIFVMDVLPAAVHNSLQQHSSSSPK